MAAIIRSYLSYSQDTPRQTMSGHGV